MAADKHCRTCMCWNVDEDAILELPPDYLPPGYYMEIIGGERFIANRRGDLDYYWTEKFRRDTEGYNTIRMALTEGEGE